MKINKISFKNINSLRGEHTIDFDQAPIADAGIFAITGNTGSGKSTLLDVITLALYNKVPRFSAAGTNKISKKVIAEMGSIVTLMMDEAYAEVEYTVNEIRYCSHWSISKTKKGNFKDYHMQLSILPSGKIFDKKKSEVPGQNAEIIGLSYEQFVKSVLLAQGQFAKFLKASEHERSKLLEDITGTRIYRDLGKMAFEREKIERNKIQLEKEKLEIIETLSEDHIEELNKEISSAKSELTTIVNKVKDFSAKIELKNRISKRVHELESITKNKIENEAKILEFERTAETIKLQDQLNPLRVGIANYIENQKKHSDQKTGLEKHITNEQHFKSVQADVINQLQRLIKDDEISGANFLTRLSKLGQSMSKLMTQLDAVEKNITETKERINQEANATESLIFNKLEGADSAIEAITVLEGEKEQLITELQELKLGSTASHKLKAELEKVTHTFNKLEKLKMYSDTQRKVDTDIERIEKKLNADSGQLNNTKQISNKLQKTLEQMDQEIKSFEKEKDRQIQMHSATDIRSTLQDGEPCPVCGAEDHPYANHILVNRIGELTIKLDNFSTQKKKQVAERQLHLETIATIEERIKITSGNKQELLEEKESAWMKIKTLRENSNGSVLDLSKIDELRQLKENLSTAITSKDELLIVERLLKSYQTLGQQEAKYQLILDQKNQLFEEENFDSICNEMREEFLSSTTELKTTKALIEKSKNEILKTEQDLSVLSETLMGKLLLLNIHSIEEASESLLNDEEIQEIKIEQQKLQDRKKELATLEKQLNTEYVEWLKKDDDAISLELLVEELENWEEKRDQLNQVKGANENMLQENTLKLAKQAKHQKHIEKMEKAYLRWKLLSDYIGDASGNKFANYAQGLTLSNLVVLANRRLRDLDDRYLLQKPTENSELRIIDQHQGNIERTVQTLSGGETFLVSLALALSLSDLASHHVALQSLFIDEGFGTLDPETLDKALTTLEKLQSEHQKTIGVISHVESLKERIHTQIQLNKTPQGYSSISIIG